MANLKTHMYLAGKAVKTKADTIAVAAAPVVPMAMSMVMAQDLEGTINTFGSNIYSFILGITSVTGGVALAICLYLMLFSKNGKTVEEATQWAKRIIICWVGIGLIGLITSFINSKLTTGNITGGLTGQGTAATDATK